MARQGSGVRRFGVRLWLGTAFAAVGIIAAATGYLFTTDSSDEAAEDQSVALTAGRTFQLADAVGEAPVKQAQTIIDASEGESFAAWAFDADGELLSSSISQGISSFDVPGMRQAVDRARNGFRFAGPGLEAEDRLISFPIFRNGRLAGAIVGLGGQSPEVREAFEAAQGERFSGLLLAAAIAILIGFIVASVITSRIKRLATSASEIAEGRLDLPLESWGRDEIGDLGQALEGMRAALKQSFEVISSERDRLSAIFEGLDDAVMVVSNEGEVRFANQAARPLYDSERRPLPGLQPWFRRAAHRGAAFNDAIRVGERVYALQARELPAEAAVLAVVRDRTEELRRELAEREFVSNAAHELRNPIAGMSGAIEVLQSGAKDDPETRDHFLARLSEDVERVARLTQSLLTLARMEAIGEGEAQVVDVAIAAEEVAALLSPPEGIEFKLEIDHDLGAQGDTVLLRQVLIGLLTNAFKNTSSPGTVILRARREGLGKVVIEISDTGRGIPPDEVDRVFERFYRGSGQLERDGFGLGLSIAKRMVDVMGGEILVRSKVGEGTTFSVRLPVVETTETPFA